MDHILELKYVVGLKVLLEEEDHVINLPFMVLNLIYVWKLLHLWHALINVFCWRHGTNPVAKLNWRWEVDPPEKVMAGALEGHYQKLNN